MLQSSLGRVGALFAGVAAFAARFHQDTRANVVAVVALSMFPLIGALALGSEAASWNVANRGMQNAADSAAVAAATAGQSGNTAYAAEGYTVAARYGYSGSDHTLTCSTQSLDCVNVINNAACPDGSGNVCYQVTISRPRALALTQALSLIGFNGDTTVGVGGPAAVAISSTALAEIKLVTAPACLLALGSPGITINGGPNGNLGGCTMASDSDVTCNGSNGSMNAGQIIYVGTNKNSKCQPAKNASSVLDPYAAALPSTAPPPGCTTVTAATIAAQALIGGCLTITGNLTLTGNVVTSPLVPTQIFIVNGNLDGANNTISSGSILNTTGGATIIFSGTGGNIGSGVNFNIAGPTTGTWKGFALVDSPTTGFTYSGNSPTWNLSGIAYFPNGDLNFSGVPNKAGSGYNCFVMVTHSVLFNGTAQLYANPTSQCTLAGVIPPQLLLGYRVPLVA